MLAAAQWNKHFLIFLSTFFYTTYSVHFNKSPVFELFSASTVFFLVAFIRSDVSFVYVRAYKWAFTFFAHTLVGDFVDSFHLIFHFAATNIFTSFRINILFNVIGLKRYSLCFACSEHRTLPHHLPNANTFISIFVSLLTITKIYIDHSPMP